MTEPHGLDPRSLIEAGRELANAHLVTSHGGNLSLRRPGGGALVTRHGAMLGRLTEADMVTVGAGGQRDERDAPEPTSNLPVHLAIYSAVPQARAVIHAHPMYAFVVASRWGVIEARLFEGRLLNELGRVPVLDAEHQDPRTVAEALREQRICMLRGHGCFAWGEDIWDAVRAVSVLEEASHIMHLLGRV